MSSSGSRTTAPGVLAVCAAVAVAKETINAVAGAARVNRLRNVIGVEIRLRSNGFSRITIT